MEECKHIAIVKENCEPDYLNDSGKKFYLSDKLKCKLCGMDWDKVTKEDPKLLIKTRAELTAKQEYAKAHTTN